MVKDLHHISNILLLSHFRENSIHKWQTFADQTEYRYHHESIHRLHPVSSHDMLHHMFHT